MQVVTPGQGVYNMPVTWYFTGSNAKRLDCVNSFTSGIWDREKPALSPKLGEQAPYQSPFYNGKNVWNYRGLCRIGTDEQFANGLTQAEATGPAPPQSSIPDCCRPPAPVTACVNYPEGLPQKFNFRIFPKPGTVIPAGWEPLFEQQTATWFSQCLWFTPPVTLPAPVFTRGWTLSFSATTWGLFVASGGFFSFTWTSAGRYPAFTFAGFSGIVTPGTLFLRESILVIVPFPEDVPVQPITLAGDVLGSADLTPAGVTIPTALVSIVSPGSAGDSTHIPVFTIDHKGRVTALTQVAVAAGGIAIGDAVGGSTPTSLLFVDGSGDLANDASLSFTAALSRLNAKGISGQNGAAGLGTPCGLFGDALHGVVLCDSAQAARFSDGVNLVSVCNGTDAVSYTPGNPPDWNAAAPTDVWKALDRLAAWIALNFGGFTPP